MSNLSTVFRGHKRKLSVHSDAFRPIHHPVGFFEVQLRVAGNSIGILFLATIL